MRLEEIFMKQKMNLFAPKIKEIERKLLELGENLFKPKNIMIMMILNIKE